MKHMHIPILLFCILVCFVNCEFNNPFKKSPNVSIMPFVSFGENPGYALDSVAYLIAITAFNGREIRDTFDFIKKEGTISEKIPKNTFFSITINGCDDRYYPLYKGKVKNYGITKDTEIYIEARMVSPLKPTDLTLTSSTIDDSIHFSWKSNSKNEDYFKIFRYPMTGPADKEYTIPKNFQKFSIKKDIEDTKDFIFKLIAGNNEGGISDASSIKWFHKEGVSQPKKLKGPMGIGVKDYKVGLIYKFHTEIALCDLGHRLQYRFDWDGAISNWKNSCAEIYSFSDGGEKKIRVQARCSVNSYMESIWSDTDIITVQK